MDDSRAHLQDWLDRAIRAHQAGNLDEAAGLYSQILAADPEDPSALHLLGLVHHQTGRHEEALAGISRALSLRPRYPAALMNLGNTYCALGRLEEAAASYRSAVLLQPGSADASLHLGNALHDLGRLEEASQWYRQALAINPQLAEAHRGLGHSLRELGHAAEAAASYRTALALGTASPEIHLGLGMALHLLGRTGEEVEAYQEAAHRWPGCAEVHANLGAALLDLDRLVEASASCRRALELQPADAGAWFNLGLACFRSGDSPGALAAVRRSLQLGYRQPDLWALFGNVVGSGGDLPVDESLLPELSDLFDQPNVHPGSLSRPVLGLLRNLPPLTAVLAAAEPETPPDVAGLILECSRQPLILKVLELTAVVDVEVERLLTRLRRWLVLTVLGPELPRGALPFLAALSHQCFINEYLFVATAEEAAGADRLQRAVAARIDAGDPVPPSWLALLGAYRPLHELPWADALLGRSWPAEIKTLLTRQVVEPRLEARFRKEIPALTKVTDPVSKAVQDQYEQNPYPRWVRTARQESPSPIHAVLQGALPGIALGGWSAPGQPEILIAGCGTGEQAIAASARFIHGRMLAVDLSRASLAYAVRKARELGITSIEFAQADLLSLGQLGRRFDLIECIGVLHHLAEPMAGWRSLAGVLNPGGLMRIALYSEAARQRVVRIRARIADQGWEPTPQGIRGFRQWLLSECTEPEREWLRSIRDFFSLSECRDLFFHVMEHRFTLPRIEACLADLDLRFLGLETAPNLRARYRACLAGSGAEESLATWHLFEQQHPDSFMGMYTFWCQKV